MEDFRHQIPICPPRFQDIAKQMRINADCIMQEISEHVDKEIARFKRKIERNTEDFRHPQDKRDDPNYEIPPSTPLDAKYREIPCECGYTYDENPNEYEIYDLKIGWVMGVKLPTGKIPRCKSCKTLSFLKRI